MVRNHIFSSSLLKDINIYIYYLTFIHFFLKKNLVTGYVKIYCSFQAGHRIGQDEGLVRDKDLGGEGGI